MDLRQYQQTSLDKLYQWWMQHPSLEEHCILVKPTGSGKSVVIAELVRLLWDTWPEEKPRTLVIVPSKELAEQNADKLAQFLPAHLHLDYYSASIGRKRPDADVIVATIGSIYKHAHILGNIKAVVIDECHLVNPDGPGMYRQLLHDLAKYCSFRVVGLTATPFRGNGVWLTDGKDPLFSGIAHEVTIQELLDAKYLAPLVRPIDAVKTRIDTTGISTASGDYAIDDLSERVSSYLPAVADEAVKLAADRKQWLAFCPTVANAQTFVDLLQERGIDAALVCGETPKIERAQLIADFRAGELRCLVTVLALATGFDVPTIDCIIWIRPTISPVLYVQGAGRGLRIADGKTDCLWIDATDTTERMGPIDKIKGRKRIKKTEDTEAPYKVCDNCGAHVRPASALECPDCGFVFPPKEEKEFKGASNAAILSRQIATKIQRYEVTNVTYHRHVKPGSPDSLRVEYWSGIKIVAREWVCLNHAGFARAKAEQWFLRRSPHNFKTTPNSTLQMLDWIDGGFQLTTPVAIHVNESGKFPDIVKFEWENNHDQNRTSGQDRLLSEGIDASSVRHCQLPELHISRNRDAGLLEIRTNPGRLHASGL